MPRDPLILAVICGLLLIPSCSNTEGQACEAASQFVEDNVGKVEKLLLSARDLDEEGYGLQANEVRGEILRTSEKINSLIIMNQNCFTPTQIEEAQQYVESIQ